MYRFLFLLFASFQLQAATVNISWVHDGEGQITEQNLTVGDQTETLEPQIRTYTLLDQASGDYTVSLNICNVAGCSDLVTDSYTIPDTPNSSSLILNITVSRDNQ